MLTIVEVLHGVVPLLTHDTVTKNFCPGSKLEGTVWLTNCELSGPLPELNTEMENCCCAVCPAASATWTVKVELPLAVGVPAIVPLEMTPSPGGGAAEPGA